jgi:hypothetical protein
MLEDPNDKVEGVDVVTNLQGGIEGLGATLYPP